MKKRLTALLATMAMAVSLIGAVPATEVKAEEKEELHFVYVSPLLAHPIWLVAKDGFEQACEELGIKGDWVGPQNISPEEMTKLVETAVAEKACSRF